ncbi:hypothetical protein GCM10009718_08080 [Isoptericola halotolerans]
MQAMHPRAETPSALHRLALHQSGLVALDQCRELGLSDKDVRGLVARCRWRRVARQVYEVRDAAPPASDLDARRRRSAWLAMLTFGPDAVAVGRCALALHGIAGLPRTIPAEAALPGAVNRRNREGVSLRQFDDGMVVVEMPGCRAVSVEWALAQSVPELPHRYGLAVLDAALRTGAVSRASLLRSHEHARGRRGVASRHVLWSEADARAESPLESFARWECIEAGVPPTMLQLPLVDGSGRVVARGDMAWWRAGGRWLVVEMDGLDVHGSPTALFADRRRQNLLTGTGAVDLLRFTSRDLGSIAGTVRRALRS